MAETERGVVIVDVFGNESDNQGFEIISSPDPKSAEEQQQKKLPLPSLLPELQVVVPTVDH